MLFTVLLLVLAQTSLPQTEAWQERHFPKPLEAPGCAFSRPSKEVGSLKDLPPQVRSEVMRFFTAGGGLADRNGEFNSTDFIDDRRVPSRRFIRAYLTEDVWFIWYEQGGFVRNTNTLALTRQRDGDGIATIFRATPGSGFTGDLCAGSKAFLSGARASTNM
jgi:hypothetical protein